MRAVRGTVVKSHPVSISKAANIISRFATAAAAGDIGTTRELTAYLGRTARAIDELDQLHLHLRSRYLTPKSDPEATLSLDDNHEKQRVADPEEGQKQNKKKNSIIDEASEQVAEINADLISRLPDAAEEVPDENRKKKKRKRKRKVDDDDDNDDEEELNAGTNINLGNENNQSRINGGIIVHDVRSENRKKKMKKIKNIEGEVDEEGQKDSTRSGNADKIEEVEGSAKRKKKKEKLNEANLVQEDGDMKNKSKKFLASGDQEEEGDALEYGGDIKKKKKKKRRKIDVGN